MMLVRQGYVARGGRRPRRAFLLLGYGFRKSRRPLHRKSAGGQLGRLERQGEPLEFWVARGKEGDSTAGRRYAERPEKIGRAYCRIGVADRLVAPRSALDESLTGSAQFSLSAARLTPSVTPCSEDRAPDHSQRRPRPAGQVMRPAPRPSQVNPYSHARVATLRSRRCGCHLPSSGWSTRQAPRVGPISSWRLSARS